MKKRARKAVAAILGYQVRQLKRRNDFKIIGIVGSIGKTSTKLAIAQTLSTGLRVRYQDGYYNDLVSVPLVFFGQEMPSLYNPLAWWGVFRRNQRTLKQPYAYDVVVVELGSDGPGQIEQFKSYLDLEIGVVTAISPEHMAFFSDMDEVAKEELAITQFSSSVLANKDLCDQKYLKNYPKLDTYAKGTSLPDGISEAEIYSLSAATAVARKFGLSEQQIKKGIENVKPVPGRMQKLAGINGSIIIDDTYNSSPEAVKLALKTIYGMEAPQKIALLGNMNELGSFSEAAHTEIGQFCDPKQLELVATLGPDANKYLAAAAEAKGCKVQTFDNPKTAGEYLKRVIKPGALILAKGSQNGVFAEEAVKLILASPKDADKLVRQNPKWLKIKAKMYNK